MIPQNPSLARPLQKLKQRGDKMMADAHQAVAEARRLAMETAELLAHSERLHPERLHDRLDGQP